MNGILLLLLLACSGGWGNGGGCECTVPFDNCGYKRDADRRSGSEKNSGSRNFDRRDSGRRPEDCGCENVSSARETSDCGCERNERNERKERDSDGSGLIPPPWQEYPKFPRRDDGDDCER